MSRFTAELEDVRATAVRAASSSGQTVVYRDSTGGGGGQVSVYLENRVASLESKISELSRDKGRFIVGV